MHTACRILTVFSTLAVASSVASTSETSCVNSPSLMQTLRSSRTTDRTVTEKLFADKTFTKDGVEVIPSVQHMADKALGALMGQDGNASTGASNDTTSIHLVDMTSQHSGTDAIAPQSTRPSLQRGQPDTVEFVIAVKKWYGIEFEQNMFHVDAVVVLQWFDLRATQSLPPNTTSISLSTQEARRQIWLPDVVFTNAVHDGCDTTSSSVLIAANGTITKVERSYLSLKQSYQTEPFPFDSQDVSVILASSTYMRDELQLVPVTERSMWGARSDIFNNSVWSLVNASLTSFDDDDGMLKKSRGVLTLRVKRSPSQYMSSIFIPSVVLLVMTWTAFWLPLGPPYAMPRVAVNAFALLCQVDVSTMANGLIPATGKSSWMSEYLELCVELQFVVSLVNVTIICIEQWQGGSALAAKLNSFIVRAFPISTCLNFCILMAGKTTSRVAIFATMIGYASYLIWKYETECEVEKGGGSPNRIG